jgi:hypothetical protein
MSAQGYTNKRRILAEASLLKVQYPTYIASKNTLSASIDCDLNYQAIVYTDICKKCVVTPVICDTTSSNTIYYAGDSSTVYCNILNDDGTSNTNYDAGNAETSACTS